MAAMGGPLTRAGIDFSKQVSGSVCALGPVPARVGGPSPLHCIDLGGGLLAGGRSCS